MKGKIVFTFKEGRSNSTDIKQDVRVYDAEVNVLVRTLANFAKTITPTQKDAEKFIAAVYCSVAGKMPPSQISASFFEQEDDTDE